MRVRVFDRATEEATWGQPGGGHPVVVEVEIADTCPVCGGPRGETRALRSPEDGEYYTVHVWSNPCGHEDPYRAVVIEARELRARKETR